MNKIDFALNEAYKAYKTGEVPIGCAIFLNDKLISKAHNTKQKNHICINHAEIIAITKAEKKLKDWRLNDCEMYVTLEPCSMCKEVIRQSRISKVYYLVKSNFNNEDNKKIDYTLLEDNDKINDSYARLLKTFFSNKR